MTADLVVDVLAVHRLTRLLTRDKVTDGLREAWIAEAYEAAGRDDAPPGGVSWQQHLAVDESPPARAYVAGCSWCVSVWTAVAVVSARRLVPGLWGPVGRVLAFSAVVGLVDDNL